MTAKTIREVVMVTHDIEHGFDRETPFTLCQNPSAVITDKRVRQLKFQLIIRNK